MSAFVVDTMTMDRCVAAIMHKGRYGQTIRSFLGLDTSVAANATKIGRILFTMNIAAVEERYPDTLDNPENMPGPRDANSLAGSYSFKRPALVEGLPTKIKALQCLRYQCSEGDVPANPVFVALGEAIGRLCERVVEGMPEYERASWG